jgi:hypothetical protein
MYKYNVGTTELKDEASDGSESESEEEDESFMDEIDQLRKNGAVTIRALKAGVIRAGVEPDSAKIGNLRAGEVFEILEEGTTKGGQQRIRMSRGWVSMTAKSGKPLCVEEAAVQLLLSKVPLLQSLDETERARVADVLEGEEIEPNHPIVVTGDPGEHMYFLEKGDAVAEVKGAVVMRYSRGDYFGELALLTDQPRKATVTSGPEGARCLKLSREAFNEFAEKCTAILEQRQAMYAVAAGDTESEDTDSETEELDSEEDDEGSQTEVSDSDDGADGYGTESPRDADTVKEAHGLAQLSADREQLASERDTRAAAIAAARKAAEAQAAEEKAAQDQADAARKEHEEAEAKRKADAEAAAAAAAAAKREAERVAAAAEAEAAAAKREADRKAAAEQRELERQKKAEEQREASEAAAAKRAEEETRREQARAEEAAQREAERKAAAEKREQEAMAHRVQVETDAGHQSTPLSNEQSTSESDSGTDTGDESSDGSESESEEEDESFMDEIDQLRKEAAQREAERKAAAEKREQEAAARQAVQQETAEVAARLEETERQAQRLEAERNAILAETRKLEAAREERLRRAAEVQADRERAKKADAARLAPPVRTDTAMSNALQSTTAPQGALDDALNRDYPEDEVDDSDTEEEAPAAEYIAEGIPPASIPGPAVQSSVASRDKQSFLDFRCLPPTKWGVEHVVAWVEFSFIWARRPAKLGSEGVAAAIRAAGLDGAELMKCGEAELARHGVGGNADERREIFALRDDQWTWVRMIDPTPACLPAYYNIGWLCVLTADRQPLFCLCVVTTQGFE